MANKRENMSARKLLYLHRNGRIKLSGAQITEVHKRLEIENICDRSFERSPWGGRGMSRA